MAARNRDKRGRGKTDPHRVIGYVRVSSDDQRLGPDAQRVALEQWCAAHGGQLVLTCTDRGVSGGAALDRRPGLLAALAAIRDKHADVLLVAKRDRLARDSLVAALVERLVERNGAAVLAADGTGNGDGPEAILLRRIVDAFAEYERVMIRARTCAALAVKKARGERISREPRYGWALLPDGVHVAPDLKEQRIVGLVRKYRRRGLALRQIGGRLLAAGLRPRSGRQWHPQTIASIVAAAPRVSPRKV
ncbi:MAG: recombinase family protein [Candidatus Binatia bacterium]|jgi:site-specific DNA recombinase